MANTDNPFIDDNDLIDAAVDEAIMQKGRIRRSLVEQGMPPNIAEILADNGPEGAYWVGCIAYRNNVCDLLASFDMPAPTKEGLKAGESGAVMMRGNLRIQRPDTIGVNLGRRAIREVESYSKTEDKRTPKVEMPVVAKLLRKVEVSRATFDVTLRPQGKSAPRAVIQALTGQQVLTYNHIRGRAAELGMFLQTGKGAQIEWNRLMAEAIPKAEVENLSTNNEDATVVLAIRSVIRRILLSAEIADTAGDLAKGAVYRAPGRMAIAPDWVFQRVRRYLADDKPTRQQINEAAESLGVQTNFRPQLGGSRPRLWSFSTKVLDPADLDYD